MREAFLVLLALASGIVTLQAWMHCKKGNFYSDTPHWWWLSVYVWGDGLVLGPLWFLLSGAAWWLGLSLREISGGFVLVHGVRSYFEIHYWIAHQATGNIKVIPPPLRWIPWLKPNDAAILFQVWHTGVVILLLLTAHLLYSSSTFLQP